MMKMMIETPFGWYELLSFWKRRWFRTLPNYFLVLSLNLLILYLISGQLLESISWYVVFMQNFFIAHPDFFTEAWSLSIEEYAYIFLPFLLVLGVHFNKRADRKYLFFVITVVTIILLFFVKLEYFKNIKVESYKYWSHTFRKVVIYRLDSIYFGFILVYLMDTFSDFFYRNKRLLLIIGLGIFAIAHLAMFVMDVLPQTHLWFYSFFYLPLVLASLAFLFPYFVVLNAGNKFKQVILFISTRSYALYLVNYSLILLNMQLFINIAEQSLFMKLVLVGVFLSLSVIMSNIIFIYFEQPILNYRDRKLPRAIESYKN